MEKKLLTVSEATALIRCSKATIYNGFDAGLLPRYEMYGVMLCAEDELLHFAKTVGKYGNKRTAGNTGDQNHAEK